ncbi:receptor-like protein 9DC3 [Citrus clementina]|uniref:receptor-like protein 9DC3 n=1 Tax=Citrus clementina TaxID=85681 RepID=UPI000CED2E01|nr:receptor-like protein 9DC3 [Citrus x clementina]
MGCLPCAYKVFCLQLLVLYSGSNAKLCSYDQSIALVQFKQLFSFKNISSSYCDGRQQSNPKMLSWNDGTDCCSWDGVTCDMVTGQVIGLDLSCSWLHGSIPSNSSLFLLPYLETLNLGSNDFNSSLISSGFGRLISLTRLNLSNSYFSGQIPSEISQLSKMLSLDLSKNDEVRIESPVWKGLIENLTKLKELVLSEVDMSTIVLDYSLTNLSSSLSYLHLTGCNLIGPIPASLANLPQLTSLSLSYNHFSGHIPSFLSHLKQLYYLNLEQNNLVGGIPDSFVNLTQLSFLDLSWNQLTGRLPSCLKGLRNLVTLRLSGNSLNGTIPSWLFTVLPYLEVIHLRDNRFTGSIPSTIFELVNLTSIRLSSNNLSGHIELCMFARLKNLQYLYLSQNRLSVNTTLNANSTFPKLLQLGLSACNISEFPEFLRSQDRLEWLQLSENKIYGRIPNWFWDIGKDTLYNLNLSDNFLTDVEQVPLKNLRFLDLRSNLLQGSVMVLPPRLIFFSISNNKLTGEIPCSFCTAAPIEFIDLSNNSLCGPIPECLVDSITLIWLDLHLNSFNGSIPQISANGSGLVNLILNDNQFEGPLPQSLANCSRLQVLNVANNRIDDTFPHWLAQLPELLVLILRSNKFYGLIGNTDARVIFPKLRILDLSRNEFTGVLPTRYFQNLKAMMRGSNTSTVQVQYMHRFGRYYSAFFTLKGIDVEMNILSIFLVIDFSSNRFEGQIPEVVGKLNLLKMLNFSHNHLTGRIPSSLRNLTVLESLDLSSNRLVGQIPTQLTSLNFLSKLNLSHNQLEGPIPQGPQFNTFQSDSYIGNLGLCGFPLSDKCSNIDDAQEPAPTDTWSWFDWKVAMMGYASGLVIGFSIGYMAFATGRPRWLVRMVERKRIRRQSTRIFLS